MKLVWKNVAREQMLAIARYIAQDKPGAAQAWLTKIRKRARDAADFPYAGRIVPEMNREDVREIIAGNYRIVYLVNEAEKTAEVHLVFESHRLFENAARGGDLDH